MPLSLGPLVEGVAEFGLLAFVEGVGELAVLVAVLGGGLLAAPGGGKVEVGVGDVDPLPGQP